MAGGEIREEEAFMKSPFPGMDPYIEACGLWGDFHHELISEIKRALAEAAPDRYVIRAEERSYLADVEITTRRRDRASGSDMGTAIKELSLVEEQHQEAFLEIHETSPDQRLVTSIEVLSPSNKRPHTPGWDLYLRKRQSLLLGDVNLVEIDLLRNGQRMPMLDPWPESPYSILVARARKYDLCQV